MSDTSLAKGTAIAAGIGAGFGTIANYTSQKYMIKRPATIKPSLEFAADFYKTAANNASKNKGIVNKFLKKCYGHSANMMNKYLDVIKTKKVNGKLVAVAAVLDAAIVGGAYLAYRGIKALFTKNN